MLLLTSSDLQNSILHNLKIENINTYIANAERAFLRDISPAFEIDVVNNLSSFFVTNMNNLNYFKIRYADVAVYFVYNYLLKQGILTQGDINEEKHSKIVYTSMLRSYYEMMKKILMTHNTLTFDSTLGYCLYSYYDDEIVYAPPIENVVYRDENYNLYSVQSVVPINNRDFAVNIIPVPSSSIFLTKRNKYTFREYVRVL